MPAALSPVKSTIVRSKKRPSPPAQVQAGAIAALAPRRETRPRADLATTTSGDENVPRTLLLATGLWTLLVVAGTRAEVFARLPGEVVAALAIFAAVFAVSAVTVDAHVRSWFEHRGPLSATIALFALAGVLLGSGAALATVREVRIGAFPWVPIVLLGIPFTLALAVAAVRAALRAGTGAVRAPVAMAPLLSRR